MSGCCGRVRERGWGISVEVCSLKFVVCSLGALKGYRGVSRRESRDAEIAVGLWLRVAESLQWSFTQRKQGCGDRGGFVVGGR